MSVDQVMKNNYLSQSSDVFGIEPEIFHFINAILKPSKRLARCLKILAQVVSCTGFIYSELFFSLRAHRVSVPALVESPWIDRRLASLKTVRS